MDFDAFPERSTILVTADRRRGRIRALPIERTGTMRPKACGHGDTLRHEDQQ
jgi:hypothetical protein